MMKKRFIVLMLSAVMLLCGCTDSTLSVTTDNSTEGQTESEIKDGTDNGGDPTVVNEEMRGVWLASVWGIDFPKKQGAGEEAMRREIDKIVSTVKAAGLNAIFFQVRPMSDALYDSDIFPTSAWLTGKQGAPLVDGFDPLKYMVEASHKEGIELHAWVNPLRITNGSAANPKIDLNSLAENNPARMNPEWVVTYAGANLCYDAGLPEVRQLICDGVDEIVKNYDVDGIIFDDYFYPYVIDDQPFNDDATFAKYGEGYEDKADWRRDNINKIIEAVYKTVKAQDENVRFGVGPCGVWQNDNGENGGSKTNGFEAYNIIYCDALAWIEGGYVDYIAPQIYWPHDSKEAPFLTLARWWNGKVRGTGVDLYISHAAYRYGDWNKPGEMTKQITNARKLDTFKGSIYYNYSSIEKNTGGLADELEEFYK